MPERSDQLDHASIRSRVIAIGAVISTLMTLAGCSPSPAQSSAVGGEAADAAAEVVAAPTSLSPTSAVPTSAASTAASTVAATAAPVATAAPATTAAPTTAKPTTVAPTTTVPAPTTTELSPAIVWVGHSQTPFAAVGGNSGGETSRIQQRLLDLGFWLSGVDGDYGLSTAQAVMAFQKFAGLEASGYVNSATAEALTAIEYRAHGLGDAGTLVEIDKDKQLLFIIHDGRTLWVFNTSTGNGQPYEEQDQNTPGEVQTGVSITRTGLHAVYRERPVGWWEGDLGRIYRPKYFSGGQAVHGSNNVPNYPASHGCVRVSIPAMDFIWDANLMPMDIPVWVHGAN